MYCSKCGKPIKDDAMFCAFCGTPTKLKPGEENARQEKAVQKAAAPAAGAGGGQPEGLQNSAGESLNPQGEPEKPGKMKKGVILGIVFGVLLLALAGTTGALFATGYAQKAILESRAKKYVRSDEYDKAAECYEELLKLDNTDESTYMILAELYLDMGDLEAAADVLARGERRIRRPSGKFINMYDDVLARLERMLADFSGTEGGASAGGEDTGQNVPEPADGVVGYDSLSQEADSRSHVNVSLVSTDVSDFPLVRLYLDVTDLNGEQIELIAPRGAVREAVNGGQFVEREVRRIEKLEGNEGLSIELIADKSGSMDWRMDQVKGVMSQFVNSLDYASGDQVELISFDSFVMYMCTKTNNVELLNNGIYNMVPTGSTAMYDALYEGVTNAGYQTGARCVIAFTDGGDNVSEHTYQEVIYLAQQNSVAIYIIGTDKDAETVLQNIASSTNGHYWYIDDLADMGDIFDEIYEGQKDLYCLEYESDGSLEQYAGRTVDFIVGDSAVTADLTTSFTPVETLQAQKHTSRYEIVAKDVSWTEANAECILKGGHLATITSEDEMNQLIDLAEESGLRFLWIGGYTSVGGSQAFGHWVTGEAFTYSAWYEGEPSRNDMDGTPEMYLMMWKLNGEWSWNDQRNDPAAELSYFIGDIGYICEYEE